MNYAIESGKITEASGSFDESAAAYLYQYQYVTNINKIDDFYVVAEIYRGEDGTACEKLRGAGKRALIRRYLNGGTHTARCIRS